MYLQIICSIILIIGIDFAVCSFNISSWFDNFIAPYYDGEQIDAFGFSYYQEPGVQFYKMIGNCYNLNEMVVKSPPDPYTSLFRVGSVTKVMIAVSVLQLYEAGKLNLNDPVVKLVPSLAGLYSDKLTVIDTLRHTPGVDERMLNIYIPGSGLVETGIDEAKLLFTANLVDPGTRISYSNLGVTIAGAVVESVSGMKLIDYLRTNIATPLNITSMFFHADLKGDYSNVCYPRVGASMEPYQIRTAASGDLYISLDGYSKFLRAVMNGQNLFRSNATVSLMKSRVYPPSSTGVDGMGFMLSIEKYLNFTVYSKDGGVFDFTSFAAFVDETQEAIFSVASNGMKYAPDFIAEKIVFDYLKNRYPNNMQPSFNFPVDSSDATVKNVLPAISGQYLGTRGGQKTPVKLLYILSPDNYVVTGNSINGARGLTFYPLINPQMPNNQLLLQSDTLASVDNRTHYLLVTFTDNSKSKVRQIEDFTFISTDQPSSSDWVLNQSTVLALFAFDFFSQLIGAFSPFFMACSYLCRKIPLAPYKVLIAFSTILFIECWLSLAFFISIFLTPFPQIYFNIHPAFIGIQVVAILRILTVSGNFFYVLYRYIIVKGGSGRKGEEDSIVVSVKMMVLYSVRFVIQIIGIPGLYALNLITFTLW